MIGTVSSFDDLVNKSSNLDNQTDGSVGGVSKDGDPYVTFHLGCALGHPDDANAEAKVSQTIANHIDGYLAGRDGTIYWRDRPALEKSIEQLTIRCRLAASSR